MTGFLALAVAAYFLWKFDKADDDDNSAVMWLLVGMAVLFFMELIFL